MAQVNETKVCGQDGCSFNKDGICLEDQAEDCPHLFFEESNENIEEDAPTTDDELEKATVSLFSGLELRASEVSVISQRFKTNLIAIIGDSDAGKTTLLATLFDLFQLGPLENFLFAGSVTLLGFETRCHKARLASKGLKPDTGKTSSKEFNFLHLAIKHLNDISKEPKNLLLSDISGERFRLARDISSSMDELAFLRSADHIVFIVDGRKLVDPRQRQAAIFSTEAFIRSAINRRIFSKTTTLNIAFSKWDLVITDQTVPIEGIKNNFLAKFSSSLKEIVFSYLASRPELSTSEIGLGYGLGKLLTSWVTNEVPTGMETIFSEELRKKSSRFFNKYQCHG